MSSQQQEYEVKVQELRNQVVASTPVRLLEHLNENETEKAEIIGILLKGGDSDK